MCRQSLFGRPHKFWHECYYLLQYDLYPPEQLIERLFFLWLNYDFSNSPDIARALSIKENYDGYIITGFVKDGTDPEMLLVMKIDFSGNEIFATMHHDPDYAIIGMDIVPNQVAGDPYLGVGFMTETQDINSNKHAVVFAIDPGNGSFMWMETYNSPSSSGTDFDMANTIVPVPSGNGFSFPT